MFRASGFNLNALYVFDFAMGICPNWDCRIVISLKGGDGSSFTNKVFGNCMRPFSKPRPHFVGVETEMRRTCTNSLTKKSLAFVNNLCITFDRWFA